jgi:hypothetical protein
VYRLPFLRLIRPRGYAPVGRLGVEPSDTCVSGRPRRPAGSRPLRGRWRCRASRPSRDAAGIQSPLPRRRRTFRTQAGAWACLLRMPPLNPGDHGGLGFGRPGVSLCPVTAWACVRPVRRAEGTIPNANVDPSSKRSPPPAGSLSMPTPARCERAGDGRGRSARCPRRSRRRPVSGRGRPPGRFILHERKAQYSKLTTFPPRIA